MERGEGEIGKRGERGGKRGKAEKNKRSSAPPKDVIGENLGQRVCCMGSPRLSFQKKNEGGQTTECARLRFVGNGFPCPEKEGKGINVNGLNMSRSLRGKLHNHKRPTREMEKGEGKKGTDKVC